MQEAAIILSALSMIVVAIIGKLQFGKDRQLEEKIGQVPPDTSLYQLLSYLQKEVEECRASEKDKDGTISNLEDRIKVLEEATT